jgi:hypothetical protein
MRRTIWLLAAAGLVVLLQTSPVQAWGAAHIGFTHVGPAGVYHYGRTVAAGPYGAYSGGRVGAYGVGGVYHAGYATGGYYGGGYYGGAYSYAPSVYSGGYAAGGFRAATPYGGVAEAGVYRRW